jgi:UDP-glucose 6-dehydrogenase
MITVYGHTGVVGSQLYRWLKEHAVNVAGVSLDAEDGEPGRGAEDWAFLCLPTLNVNGVQDQSAIWEVCKHLRGRVVVRSTVLPGTCARIQLRYPHLIVYHWPEFLSARTAWEDFCSPRLRIVGGEYEVLWETEIEPLLPRARQEQVRTTTSELLKYAHNGHGAMQVVFANMLYDACEQSGASWEHVQVVLPEMGYISQETARAYWDVWKDGQRGYGGTCFPKDVDALRGWMQNDLLDGIASANAKLRGVP